jgi:hypothetical protein
MQWAVTGLQAQLQRTEWVWHFLHTINTDDSIICFIVWFMLKRFSRHSSHSISAIT